MDDSVEIYISHIYAFFHDSNELNTRGGSSGYNSFEFSSDKSYYAMSCDGPHVPQVYIII